jgi:hypothetical protein
VEGAERVGALDRERQGVVDRFRGARRSERTLRALESDGIEQYDGPTQLCPPTVHARLL